MKCAVSSRGWILFSLVLVGLVACLEEQVDQTERRYPTKSRPTRTVSVSLPNEEIKATQRSGSQSNEKSRAEIVSELEQELISVEELADRLTVRGVIPEEMREFVARGNLGARFEVSEVSELRISFKSTSNERRCESAVLDAVGFVESEHSLQVVSAGQAGEYEDILIDGHAPYGVEGPVTPDVEILGVEVCMDGDTINAPPSAFVDLFNVRVEPGLVEAYSDDEYLFVLANGGEGTASYCVKWVFSRERLQYVGRIVLGYDYSMMCEAL